MLTFSLLWLNGAGGNESVSETTADSASEAARKFGLESTFEKHPNGGAWCVAEVFNPLGI